MFCYFSSAVTRVTAGDRYEGLSPVVFASCVFLGPDEGPLLDRRRSDEVEAPERLTCCDPHRRRDRRRLRRRAGAARVAASAGRATVGRRPESQWRARSSGTSPAADGARGELELRRRRTRHHCSPSCEGSLVHRARGCGRRPDAYRRLLPPWPAPRLSIRAARIAIRAADPAHAVAPRAAPRHRLAADSTTLRRLLRG